MTSSRKSPSQKNTSKAAKKTSSATSDKEMPLVAHLLELRSRLLWSFLFFVLSFAVLYPFSQYLFAYLVTPLADLLTDDTASGEARRLIYTGLPEAFLTYLKVTLFAAFFVSFPLLAIQIWRFIMPGLYKNEKETFFIFMVATPLLFIIGAGFAFYGIIPMAWKFFLSYETSAAVTGLAIRLEARVSEYLSMTLQMMIAFGLCFQLPLVLLLLAKLGVLSSRSLAEKRRYAIVLILIASAVLTPPDVLSMMGLAVPLYGLYELSILLVRFLGASDKDQEKN
ncbi:MAG: twin-arginine translocase subunit TatC [Alphaproteobacteria bacterium]|nr:twin-arginine translocase subunit TatC [Alphaproteobacteria bacterium]NCQ67424.1 twin-arginine translocase subunit TatC [Alphaproteobacteria bacterium]NCT08043.1 twin-arginine translocase subunit TatC [Alphaproteobacteria bacterium]